MSHIQPLNSKRICFPKEDWKTNVTKQLVIEYDAGVSNLKTKQNKATPSSPNLTMQDKNSLHLWKSHRLLINKVPNLGLNRYSTSVNGNDRIMRKRQKMFWGLITYLGIVSIGQKILIFLKTAVMGKIPFPTTLISNSWSYINIV